MSTLLRISLSLLLSIVVSMPVYGQSKQQSYEESIGQIGKQIKSVSRNLNANKALLKTERDELFKTEQEIIELSKKLEKTEYEQAKNEHELEALGQRSKHLAKEQEKSRDALIQLLKKRYQNGKSDYLKSVLNQENPYAVGRLANYHDFFSTALQVKYARLAELAQQTTTLAEQQRVVIKKLAADKKKQLSLKQQQEASKAKRTKTVAKLDKKVATNAEKLAVLAKDRERLSSLLKELKKQAAKLKRIQQERAKERAAELARQQRQSQGKATKPPARVLVKGGFAKQKGRLSYPVSGQPSRKFGGRLPESGMRAEGHFFYTNGSVSVKSIFRGRVLFADFLKGYGQLIIVDHGDNHISLYGHNNQLLKRVGDTVENNEIIAKSGVTGGLRSHGLYFEIRNNATPVDPAKWCR